MNTHVKPLLKLIGQNVLMIIRVVLIVQATGFFAFSFVVSADDIEEGRVVLSQPCPVASVQSDGCPTCGMTRGVASMGSFEWGRAWDYNPMSVFLFTLELLLLLGLLRRTSQQFSASHARRPAMQ